MTPAQRRCILVVEDEHLTRDLLVSVLRGAGFQAEEAGDALSAITLIRELDPDAVVLDLQLGEGPGGAEVLAAIDRIAPWIAIVILTNAPSARVAGVPDSLIPERAAYLNKRVELGGGALLSALEDVLSDRPPQRHDRSESGPLSTLSADQLDVLRLVAAGLTNAEIGRMRGTSAHAVEQVFNRVLTKLGIRKGSETNPRVRAARIYYAHGPGP